MISLDLLSLVPALAAFMVAVLALSMFVLAAAGHFPVEQRIARFRGATGAAVLWGSIALALAALVLALLGAWRALPPSIAIIVGGGMILAAPLALRSFPDRFVDGRSGLAVLAGAALAAALVLWRLSG